MRTLTALLLALAACGSDDTGDDDPGVDGGNPTFVGDFDAVWTPDYGEMHFVRAVVVAHGDTGGNSHVLEMWPTEPVPDDFYCLDHNGCAGFSMRTVGNCLVSDDESAHGMVCLTSGGFSGSLMDSDVQPTTYTITLTRR